MKLVVIGDVAFDLENVSSMEEHQYKNGDSPVVSTLIIMKKPHTNASISVPMTIANICEIIGVGSNDGLKEIR